MSYAMPIYETDEAFDARTDPTKADEYWAAWTAYHGALREARVTTGGGSLKPGHAGPDDRYRGRRGLSTGIRR